MFGRNFPFFNSIGGFYPRGNIPYVGPSVLPVIIAAVPFPMSLSICAETFRHLAHLPPFIYPCSLLYQRNQLEFQAYIL